MTTMPVIELPVGYSLERKGDQAELRRNGVLVRVFSLDTPLGDIEEAAAFDYRRTRHPGPYQRIATILQQFV